jgi:pentapeptide MXKDX repeat protein
VATGKIRATTGSAEAEHEPQGSTLSTTTFVSQNLKEGFTMKKLTVMMMSACLMMGAVSTTYAADAMAKKDTMGHMSKDCMKKDSISKDSMAKDSMGKDCMSKDHMKKDSMSKDSMSKNSMSKDTMSKDAMKKDTSAQ